MTVEAPEKKIIEYNYKDIPTLRDFSRCDKFIRVLMGPWGSGKSSGCVMELALRGNEQIPSVSDGVRRTRFAVVRNTYPQLEDTTIKTVFDWLPPEDFGRYDSTKHIYTVALDGLIIEMLFRALDRPDHVRNLLSLELTGAWFNEIREIPKSIFDAMQGRVGRYPRRREGGATWAGVIADTNPPDTDSWLWKYCEEELPSNAAVFKQPSGKSAEAENLANLPDHYYENLAQGKTKEFVDAYVHGQYAFVVDGKPVYPEYHDQTHCAKEDIEPDDRLKVDTGWDFGLWPSCVLTQMLPTGQWIVFDEIIGDEISTEEFRDHVIEYVRLTWPRISLGIEAGDPAGEAQTANHKDKASAFKILRAGGVKIVGGEQGLLIRTESVKKPLGILLAKGRPGLLLSPRCKKLRKGFLGGYHYRRKAVSGKEMYHDAPEKNEYSHPHDALQYIATKIFGPRLKEKKKERRREDYGTRRSTRPLGAMDLA